MTAHTLQDFTSVFGGAARRVAWSVVIATLRLTFVAGAIALMCAAVHFFGWFALLLL